MTGLSFSKYASLCTVSLSDLSLSGQRYHIATETTPLPAKPEILQKYYDHWYEVANNVLEVAGVIGTIAFQPMPTQITSKAQAKGGVS